MRLLKNALNKHVRLLTRLYGITIMARLLQWALYMYYMYITLSIFEDLNSNQVLN